MNDKNFAFCYSFFIKEKNNTTKKGYEDYKKEYI